MPKVSVIVPVYKAERTLARCVDSILAQTYTDFELLLIDDGSPDNSSVLCDEYAKKDPRIRVFHKSNGGVSSARNLGLDKAQGEWISFVDSDDIIESDYYNVPMTSNDIIGSDLIFLPHMMALIDENCKIKDIDRSILYNDIQIDESSIKIALEPNNIKTVWGKLYKKQCFRTIKFNEKLRLGEDTLFNLEVLNNVAKICFSKNSFKASYIFDTKDDKSFVEKYQMSVDYAVESLKQLLKAYYRLNVSNLAFEVFISYVFRQVCDNDMSKNWKLWYHDKFIKSFSIQKAKKLGTINLLKTYFVFLTFGYPLLNKLGYK